MRLIGAFILTALSAWVVGSSLHAQERRAGRQGAYQCVLTIGAERTPPVHAPTSFAIGPTGLLAVFDLWDFRVKVLDSKGVVLSGFGGLGKKPGMFGTPQIPVGHFNPLTLLDDGSVIVLDGVNDRVQKLGRNGSGVVIFGGSGSGAGQFRHPMGLALGPDGSIFVADTGNKRVQKLDRNGTFLLEFRLRPGTEKGDGGVPMGITADASGNVYVVAEDYREVQAFDGQGNFLRRIATPATDKWLSQPVDVFHDGKRDCLFVVDAEKGDVHQVGLQGGLIRTFGAFSLPQMAATQGETLYVLEMGSTCDITMVDLNTGRKIGSALGFTAATLRQPSGVAVSSDGRIVVADAMTRRVSIFDPKGVLLSQFDALPQGRIEDVTVDNDGRILVLGSYRQATISCFTEDGHLLFSSEPAGGNQLKSPNAICATKDGAYLVADRDRVTRFRHTDGDLRADGMVSLPAGVYGVAADDAGAVYMVSQDTLYKFTEDLKLLKRYSVKEMKFRDNTTIMLVDVAVFKGRIFLLDNGNDRVLVVNDQGKAVTSFDGPSAGTQPFAQLSHICVDKDGHLYVTDLGNARVLKFAPSERPAGPKP